MVGMLIEHHEEGSQVSGKGVDNFFWNFPCFQNTNSPASEAEKEGEDKRVHGLSYREYELINACMLIRSLIFPLLATEFNVYQTRKMWSSFGKCSRLGDLGRWAGTFTDISRSIFCFSSSQSASMVGDITVLLTFFQWNFSGVSSRTNLRKPVSRICSVLLMHLNGLKR